jgi:hypothetical protein
MISWLLNDVDLAEFGVTRGSVFRAPVSVRGELLTIPGQHGGAGGNRLPVFEAAPVTLEFVIHGPDTNTRAADLYGLLAAPTLTLTRVDGEITASARAVLLSVAPGEYVNDVYAQFTVVLQIPAVFFRALPHVATVKAGRVEVLPQLAGSTAPITDAIFRLPASCTAAQITCPVTGTGLTWAGGAHPGQYLYLCARTLRAWVSASPDGFTNPGASFGTADFPPAGRLQLWPATGGESTSDRQVAVVVTGTGINNDADPTHQVAVHAAAAYL